MKRFLIIILLTALLLPMESFAQKRNIDSHNRLTFGIGGGFRADYMTITEITPTFEEANSFMLPGFVFSGFVYREFGEAGIFALRAQGSYLTRGAYYHFKRPHELYGYDIFAHYADFRLPVIINFIPYHRNRLQPYMYLTPIFGTVTDGIIVSTYDDDNIPDLKLTKANIAEYYFGLGGALGIKYNWESNSNRFFIGVEVLYDHGLTDTYSQQEKDGRVNDVAHYVDYEHEPLKGERLFKGIEYTAVVGFSLKSKYKYKPKEKDKPVVVKKADDVPQAKEVIEESKEEEVVVEESKKEEIVVEENKKEEVVELKPVTFAFRSTDLTAEGKAYLDSLALMLKNDKTSRIKIIGHTDSRGSYAYNLQLSRLRAKTVLEYLAKQGVARARMSYDGLGANRPAADNSTEEGRAKNRRVEFEIN